MRLFFATFLFSLLILPHAYAQETLPGFSASMKSNGKVLISWRNNYPVVNQISIQRSTDSLRNFTTLITVPDPRIPENGFVDSKANGSKLFYRIFILFPDSRYLFTKSRRAKIEANEQVVSAVKPTVKVKPNTAGSPANAKSGDTTTGLSNKPVTSKPAEQEEQYLILPKIDNARIYYMMDNSALKKPSVSNPGRIKAPTIEVQKILYVKKANSIIMQLDAIQLPRFSDSILKHTKDTLLFVDVDTLQINPFVEIFMEPKEVYKISAFVFTSKDGNVTIALSDFNRKKYWVSFFEMDDTPVMEVKDIRDAQLIIDKTNFGHSGWFRFSLYEDGKLKEKNKLFIPKE